MSPIIKHAQADATDNIKSHIAEAPYSADLNPGENVGNLRFVVFPNIYAQKLSVRVLQATVFRRLEPITNLRSGEEFMKVWFQCVQSHYARWERGVGHTDPSVVNLMTNPFDKSKGIFNDWDLAIIRVPDEENLPHSERTGTLPFMAIDLLTKAYYDGETPRLYRHDLEAFIWILPWVFLQYQNGERAFNILRSWESADYRDVRSAKTAFLAGFDSEYGVEEDSSFYNEWLITMELLTWLKMEDSYRTVKRRKSQRKPAPTASDQKDLPDYFITPSTSMQEDPNPEKETKQVYIDFWNVIIGTKQAYHKKLSYVSQCIPRTI